MNKFKRSRIAYASLLAMSSSVILVAAPAVAQTAEPERVEVTGSRLRLSGSLSSSPIASVGKADIETTQPVAVEELIRGLPSAYPAIGPNINNGSNGTASIDLRGLGSNRTLVLINSKRFVPATLGGVVDTNSVPVSLLERVDLVTGGASAVYGADAISGVVNFITKRNFTGIEATTLYSVSEQGDAQRRKNDLTLGANLADGRGNVALHVGTTRTEAIRLGDRDFANTVISSSTGAPGGFSGTSVPAVWSGMPAPISGSRVIDGTSGVFRAANASAPPDGYNTNPPNYFETPLTRTQATALGRFTINQHAEAYAEIFHTRSNVTLNLAPSGTFGVALNIPIGNPYITAPIRQQLCAAYSISAANCLANGTTEFRANIARRFVEAGPRIYSYDNTSTQYTAGVRGSVPMFDSWSYDAYYQSGRAEQIQTTGNGFSFTKLQQAVRATSTTACTVSTGGCVPINLFGPAGSISQAMLNYISIPTFQTTLVRQEVISASANGEVSAVKSPMARSPLNLAVGLEHRTVFGGNKSDSVVQTQGELLGSGAPTPDRNGELSFKEVYLEASLPLVQNKPMAQAINIGGGYRDTEFTTSSGGTKSYGSWKAGVDWTPVKGLRLRGEQQRATRAPNVNELFAPVTTGLATLAIDPCQGTRITAGDAGKAGTLTSLCQQTGVPTSQIGAVSSPSSSQINNTSGGNPNLGPETADTTTLGLVWDLGFVDNLSVSLDYWKIKVDGAVSSATAGQVINGCYDATLNPGFTYNVFCQAIQRDALNGTFNGTGSKGVITQSSNLGAFNYSGIDVGVAYRLPLSKIGKPNLGRVDMSLQMSLLNRADFKSLPTVATLEQAGYYGVDVGTPYSKTRFSQRTTWLLGKYSLGYNWRHVGGATEQPGGTTYLPEYSTIKAYNYFDLNGTWQAHKNVKLSLTINNAFDKKPPFVGTGIAPGASNFGNTMPTVYDVIGRRFTLTAQATF
jgi:iron complex outermembrane recepter protein